MSPLAKVSPKAILEEGCWIGPRVVIEEGARIGAYSVIGSLPEHRSFFGDTDLLRAKGVRIGRGVRIFEFVTVHSGTMRPTELMEGASVFNHSHIAHDCILGINSTVGGHASVAGHCVLMEGAFVGGLTAVHQWCVIGAYSIVAASAFLKGHVPPGEKWVGNPARPAGKNEIGLQRNGMSYADCMDRNYPAFQTLIKGAKL